MVIVLNLNKDYWLCLWAASFATLGFVFAKPNLYHGGYVLYLACVTVTYKLTVVLHK